MVSRQCLVVSLEPRDDVLVFRRSQTVDVVIMGVESPRICRRAAVDNFSF